MNKLYQAALDYYKAKKSEALAHLDIYFNESVGIGEHSDLLKEVLMWTEKLTDAEDNIKTLQKNFGEYNESN